MRSLRLLRPLLVAAGLLLLAGCGTDRGEVRIASQDFIEQKLLAEMMALLAEEHGMEVQRSIPYGDNRHNLEAIQRQLIDAYPAYSGSLLSLSGVGVDAAAPEDVSQRVRELVEPLGLRWLEPFGLANNFVLAVRRYDAVRYGLATIADLERLPAKPHFGVDPGFLSRPVDGLYALARHYGLGIGKVSEFPIDNRRALFRALLEGEIDVAEAFSTDAGLTNYGVVALEDNLNFYPDYFAAPLVRSAVLEASPGLGDRWLALAGRIDQQTMRRLNGRVALSGEDYRDVARDYLESIQLIAPRPEVERKREVTLAINPLSSQGLLTTRASDAIRAVMPARRLGIEVAPRPADAVRSGDARFGMVGAEEFYRLESDGEVARIEDIEVAGVVGVRYLHLVQREDGPAPTQWRRISVGSPGGSSWTVAQLLLHALGLSDAIEIVPIDNPQESAERLLSGELDATLLMVELGHPGLVQALRRPSLRLAEVKAFQGDSEALRYPFLRQAIIPSDIYPGQVAPLPTLSSQVVIATRVPLDTDPVGESGPGYVPGVFTRLPQRLSPDTARRLNQALDFPEIVDPVLPASPGLKPRTAPTEPRVEAEPPSALLNIFAVAFLIAMLVLYLRPLPANPALSMKSTPKDE